MVSANSGSVGMGFQPDPVSQQGDGGDGDGLDDDPDLHLPVDDRLCGRAGRFLHDIGVAFFDAQGQGGGAIGDQVQPQQLDGSQGGRQPARVARKMMAISARLQESR